MLKLACDFERFKHLTATDTNLFLDSLLCGLQILPIVHQDITHAELALVLRQQILLVRRWVVDFDVFEKTLHGGVWLMYRLP